MDVGRSADLTAGRLVFWIPSSLNEKPVVLVSYESWEDIQYPLEVQLDLMDTNVANSPEYHAVPWSVTKRDIRRFKEALASPSELGPNYTKWNELCFLYNANSYQNNGKPFITVNKNPERKFNDYMNGVYDGITKPNYVPSTTKMPDWDIRTQKHRSHIGRAYTYINRVVDKLLTLTHSKVDIGQILCFLRYVKRGYLEPDFEYEEICFSDPNYTIKFPANRYYIEWPYKPYFAVEQRSTRKEIYLRIDNDKQADIKPYDKWDDIRESDIEGIKSTLMQPMNKDDMDYYLEELGPSINKWQYTCYLWNRNNRIIEPDFLNDDYEEAELSWARWYFNGELDEMYKKNKRYIPSTSQIPNWKV